MKRKIFFALAALIILAAPIIAVAGYVAAPSAVQTVPTIPVTGDPDLVKAILAFLGFGLVFIVNLIKGWFKIDGKGAVILTIGVSLVATAITLVVGHIFTVVSLIIYGAAVVGEMTGWYKLLLTPKSTA